MIHSIDLLIFEAERHFHAKNRKAENFNTYEGLVEKSVIRPLTIGGLRAAKQGGTYFFEKSGGSRPFLRQKFFCIGGEGRMNNSALSLFS